MNSALDVAKNLSIKHNVSFNVYDEITGQLLQHHQGHNAATNSMLTGIGHYLMGDGVLNQGYAMLEHWVPQYISLGTMGLYSQDSDNSGLPAGIGYSASMTEEANFVKYSEQTPGFGADGYDADLNNNRIYFGLGHTFNDRPLDGHVHQEYIADGTTRMFNTTYPIASIVKVTVNNEDVTESTTFYPNPMTFSLATIPAENAIVEIEYVSTEEIDRTVDCELISDAFPRAQISYRKLIPEKSAEVPKTIDIVLSAMISTGAFKTFRESDKDYIFITEAGLWSNRVWPKTSNGSNDYFSGDNGLLAGYRIMPPDLAEQDMTVAENRDLLKHEILRVGSNQVVQVVWKIQLGAMSDLQDTADARIIAQANQILENAINGTS